MLRTTDFLANRSLRALRDGELSIGTVAIANSATAAGMLARSGLGHVVVDLQHGEWDEGGRIEAIRSISVQGSTPIVRVASNTFADIGRALDIGALGVVVPMVNNASEARRAAAATRYPPVGERSVSHPLAVHYPVNYWDRANDEVMLIVQIETAEGIRNAEEIASTDGVDAIMAGPTDIWFSTGKVIGSSDHDAALKRVLDACRAAGKIPGTFAGTSELAKKWIDEGFRLLTVGTDLGYLSGGVRHMVDEIEARRNAQAANVP